VERVGQYGQKENLLVSGKAAKEGLFRDIIARYVKKFYVDDKLAIELEKSVKIKIINVESNTAGWANIEENLIVVNNSVYELNWFRFEQVIMHEFVHLLQGREEHEHTGLFEKEMNRLGFNKNLIYHNLRLAYLFKYKCRKCEKSVLSKERLQINECYFCGVGRLTLNVMKHQNKGKYK
jgi:predicted SprT family Zn-dependent metalloprotease